jgi:hypothetical protein
MKHALEGQVAIGGQSRNVRQCLTYFTFNDLLTRAGIACMNS